MSSKSEKQKRFMEAAAHNKEFADKAGIDQKCYRPNTTQRNYGS